MQSPTNCQSWRGKVGEFLLPLSLTALFFHNLAILGLCSANSPKAWYCFKNWFLQGDLSNHYSPHPTNTYTHTQPPPPPPSTPVSFLHFKALSLQVFPEVCQYLLPEQGVRVEQVLQGLPLNLVIFIPGHYLWGSFHPQQPFPNKPPRGGELGW